MSKSNSLSSPDTERAIIGVIIATSGEVLDHLSLPSEAFLLSQTRESYEAALRLYSRGAKIDPTALIGELGQKYEAIGKAQFEAMIQWVPPENIGMYEGILKDKLLLRRLKGVGESIVRDVQGDRVNPLDVLGRATVELAKVDEAGDSTNLLPQYLDDIEKELLRIEMGEPNRYIPSGFRWYDKSFGGILPGDYTAIASRPGCGKTALIEAIIQNLIRDENRTTPVLVFQRDMSPRTFVYRLACRAAQVKFKDFQRANLKGDEIARIRMAARAYRSAPVILKSPAGMTVDTMIAEMRREVRVNKIGAVFLDHVQALSHSKDITEDLTRASMAIRQATTDLNVATTVLAHINRQGDENPTASNIKGFDQLYGDVDNMLILFRNKEDDDERDDNEVTEDRSITARVAKCRTDALRDIQLIFHGPMMNFSEVPKDDQ